MLLTASTFFTNLSLVLFGAIVILFLGGITIRAAWGKQKTRQRAIALKLAILLILAIVANGVFTTQSTMNQLSTLVYDFQKVVGNQSREIVYSQEKGYTVSYAGKLDEIISNRNSFISKNDLISIAVSWTTSLEGSLSFQGVYLSPNLLITCLAVWGLDVCILLFGKKLKKRAEKSYFDTSLDGVQGEGLPVFRG